MGDDEAIEYAKDMTKALSFLLTPELAKTLAIFHRTLFQELLNVGFSPDQALQLCRMPLSNK